MANKRHKPEEIVTKLRLNLIMECIALAPIGFEFWFLC